jgi:hypothetical protein
MKDRIFAGKFCESVRGLIYSVGPVGQCPTRGGEECLSPFDSNTIFLQPQQNLEKSLALADAIIETKHDRDRII